MALSLTDPDVLRRAAAAVEQTGWERLTMEQLAAALGVSRVTLHRHRLGKDEVRRALAAHLEREYQQALWPALTAQGDARERLAGALDALCEVSERHLALTLALADADRDAVFHERGEARPGAGVLTRDAFTAPLTRLLADGARDGTLEPGDDPEETATVLFNLVGWTYHHLRMGHGWPPERARRGVVGIALRGVAA
jgi:AcrR family transcriptional regulator